MLTVQAHAKINLTLEVLSQDPDGYHQIVSVAQTVSLHDTLDLEPGSSLTLECDNPSLDSSDNLVIKAAELLREASGTSQGAGIRLNKVIPLASGLGGGSSDAAAALLGLNRLWGLGLTRDELMPIAAQIGSDVPLFLHQSTVLVQGRGERVRPLPPANIEWLVILCPSIGIPNKTGTLYSMLPQASYTRGLLGHKLAGRIRGGGDVPAQFLFNAFDDIAFDAYPGLERYWRAFESIGAREIHLAGSGPSIYALVPRREIGTAWELLLKHTYGWDAYLVSRWEPTEGEPS